MRAAALLALLVVTLATPAAASVRVRGPVDIGATLRTATTAHWHTCARPRCAHPRRVARTRTLRLRPQWQGRWIRATIPTRTGRVLRSRWLGPIRSRTVAPSPSAPEETAPDEAPEDAVSVTPRPTMDTVAGWRDPVAFGTTAAVRERIGDDVVDQWEITVTGFQPSLAVGAVTVARVQLRIRAMGDSLQAISARDFSLQADEELSFGGEALVEFDDDLDGTLLLSGQHAEGSIAFPYEDTTITPSQARLARDASRDPDDWVFFRLAP